MMMGGLMQIANGGSGSMHNEEKRDEDRQPHFRYMWYSTHSTHIQFILVQTVQSFWYSTSRTRPLGFWLLAFTVTNH